MIIAKVTIKGEDYLAEGWYNDDGEFCIARLLKKL